MIFRALFAGKRTDLDHAENSEEVIYRGIY